MTVFNWYNWEATSHNKKNSTFVSCLKDLQHFHDLIIYCFLVYFFIFSLYFQQSNTFDSVTRLTNVTTGSTQIWIMWNGLLHNEQVWTCLEGRYWTRGCMVSTEWQGQRGVSLHMTCYWRMASWVMVTWRPPPRLGRQTDVTENITFRQLRWRAVISNVFSAQPPYTCALHISLQRNHILSQELHKIHQSSKKPSGSLTNIWDEHEKNPQLCLECWSGGLWYTWNLGNRQKSQIE